MSEEELEELESFTEADESDGSTVGPGFGNDGQPGRRDAYLLRGPLMLVGVVIATLVIGAYLYFSDENSERWELRCTRGLAEARQGLYFPWGTKRIADDAHDPLELPEGVSCASVSPGSLEELDQILGDLLLEAAEHRLQQGGPEALAGARQDVERARRLQGLSGDQRRRADALLADMAYHEAREILRQVERSLWQARRKLERARNLGASERISDLDDWLGFIETETERFRPAMDSSRPDEEQPIAEPELDVPQPTPDRQDRPHPPQDVFL